MNLRESSFGVDSVWMNIERPCGLRGLVQAGSNAGNKELTQGGNPEGLSAHRDFGGSEDGGGHTGLGGMRGRKDGSNMVISTEGSSGRTLG
jgi:hypothetical protein